MFDPIVAVAANNAHKSVSEALHREKRVVLYRTPKPILHHAVVGWSPSNLPPRDFNELRDTVGRFDWRDYYPGHRLPDPREVYEHASIVGYRIDEHVRVQLEESWTDKQAWLTANEFLDEHLPGLWDRDGMPEFLELRRRVIAVLPYFIIPDKDNRPIVIRQLWLVADKEGKAARWIALDFAYTADRSKTAFIDRQIESHGIEVFRIGAWWFRVDPYRAMIEFLREVGLLSRRYTYTGEGALLCIADYSCDSCRHPMDRREGHSIDDLIHDRRQWLVHHDCAEDVQMDEWTAPDFKRAIF